MTVIERIVGQMKAAFEGGAWHGPAVLELLQDVDPITAMGKPIPEAHSIWELVAHLTATHQTRGMEPSTCSPDSQAAS